MIRCPIVLERLAWDEGAGQVVCRSRPARRSGPLPAEARWDVLEFATARAIRESLEPPAQESEPLAQVPPEAPELIAETA